MSETTAFQARSLRLSAPGLPNSRDFSVNQFSGNVLPGIDRCRSLQVFRAGFNSITGWIPYDLYTSKNLREISLSNNHFSGTVHDNIVFLPKLNILELHVNELTGPIPSKIGLLSKLKQLQLHSNRLNGSLPSSLTECSHLTSLLLRNNLFVGDICDLDFSKLKKLQVIDLGNKSFTGKIPDSLCSCRSLTAVRLAYNQLVGEIPSCVASLSFLTHLSLSNNYRSNVTGAMKTLTYCENLAILLLSRCFHAENMPDDDEFWHPKGFQNLQMLGLGGHQLKGEIPSWISKLRKLEVLNLSNNQISGQIPSWIGSMPSLFVLNLTQNLLSGTIPHEICQLPALINTDDSSREWSYLALPFLFTRLEYNRLFNLPRGLKLGNNKLRGNIPAEIGRLKLLDVLELSNNNFNGKIPDQLSDLVDLVKLDLSGNHLLVKSRNLYQVSISCLRLVLRIMILKERFQGEASSIHFQQIHSRGILSFVRLLWDEAAQLVQLKKRMPRTQILDFHGGTT